MAAAGGAGSEAQRRKAAAGRAGESVAARHLERLGYRIVERNFRCEHGEVDLIAEHTDYLVFVEVKTRTEETEYDPTLSITQAKKARVRRLGDYYRGLPGTEPGLTALQPRFDVVAVTLSAPDEGRVEHYLNAF